MYLDFHTDDADATFSSLSRMYLDFHPHEATRFPLCPEWTWISTLMTQTQHLFLFVQNVPGFPHWWRRRNTFSSLSRMYLDFHTDDAGFSDEVVLQIDHRHNYGAGHKRVLWFTTDSAGKWGPQHELMATLPVAFGDSFNLSLVLEENQLQVSCFLLKQGRLYRCVAERVRASWWHLFPLLSLVLEEDQILVRCRRVDLNLPEKPQEAETSRFRPSGQKKVFYLIVQFLITTSAGMT